MRCWRGGQRPKSWWHELRGSEEGCPGMVRTHAAWSCKWADTCTHALASSGPLNAVCAALMCVLRSSGDPRLHAQISVHLCRGGRHVVPHARIQLIPPDPRAQRRCSSEPRTVRGCTQAPVYLICSVFSPTSDRPQTQAFKTSPYRTCCSVYSVDSVLAWSSRRRLAFAFTSKHFASVLCPAYLPYPLPAQASTAPTTPRHSPKITSAAAPPTPPHPSVTRSPPRSVPISTAARSARAPR